MIHLQLNDKFVYFHETMYMESYAIRLGCSSLLLCELQMQHNPSLLNLHGNFLYGSFSLRSLR